tara:strand:+ start:1689 stop:2030 length:342 start_codon:yes stop_codon:yes gene_type:complete
MSIKQQRRAVFVSSSQQNILFISSLYAEGFIKAYRIHNHKIKVFFYSDSFGIKGKKIIPVSHHKKNYYSAIFHLWSSSGLCSFFLSTHKGIFSMRKLNKNDYLCGGKLLATTI